jgi:protein transport protein DSL1/ZW10
VALDIDGWIAQAQQIQEDINQSKAIAHEIAQEAESNRALCGQVEDTKNKVILLEKELVFNEILADTIGQIQGITNLYKDVELAAAKNDIYTALERLKDAEASISQLHFLKNAKVTEALRSTLKQLRDHISDIYVGYWSELVKIESGQRCITIKASYDCRLTQLHSDALADIIYSATDNITFASVIEVLVLLKKFDVAIARLSHDFERLILVPILVNSKHHLPMQLHITANKIYVSEHATDLKAENVLLSLESIVEFLSTHLPPSVTIPLSKTLWPRTIGLLIENWLDKSIPVTLEDLQSYGTLLDQIRTLAEKLDNLGWVGKDLMQEWIDSVPYGWIQLRKNSALSDLRSQCRKMVQDRVSVERAETQVLHQNDVLHPQQSKNEDDEWKTDWDATSDKGESINKSTTISKVSDGSKHDEDGDDAWGWDESDEKTEKEDHAAAQVLEKPFNQVDSSKSDVSKRSNTAQTMNGDQTLNASDGRALTLRETYTVTGIPEAIVNITAKIVSDADQFHLPE